ncbi:cation transporter HKT8-like [Ananas comosus]|uniref:Cation transporter HKT8-like n=1 Tax=Ananas comosus TaxID=4615 RepID=A0A6P5GT61_ANACO|nr:cation transporter HKT8-like [Ananas comosus]
METSPPQKRSPLHLHTPLHLLSSLYRFALHRVHPFWIQLFYFIFVSCIGFILLRSLPMRRRALAVDRPADLDLFFMSLSATSLSSMDVVEMESFSTSQLLVFTLLMLLGGEVFVSMLGLHFMKIKLPKKETSHNSATMELTSNDQVELESIKPTVTTPSITSDHLRYNSIRYLGFIVLGYLMLVHFTGYILILWYITLNPSAGEVLSRKAISRHTFAVFTTVSSFGNCGFLPTNENMIVFKKNPGLLLLVMPQILAGNTLYPAFLRSAVWVLEKCTKKEEFGYILRKHGEIGYDHLFPKLHTSLLGLTVVGLIVVQLLAFCFSEWRVEGLEGMSSYEKLVGALFMSVNSRHSGEMILDLSTLSSAMLVLYVVMMYLPPYTYFLPLDGDDHNKHSRDRNNEKRTSILQRLMFSQVTYLAIFVIIICITEKRGLSKDPLNYNVLNIVVEVVSAYGNVGFSTGYSCKRQLKPDGFCRDEWIGFSGKWSSKGKLTLMAVMLFGRLKMFSMSGGSGWKLN